MTSIDQCEPAVIRAFQKGNWQLFKKPFLVRIEKRTFRADLSFSRQTESEQSLVVVVEVKCFNQIDADTEELYRAVGQYQFYRTVMRLRKQNLPLYLTIPLPAFERFQARPEVLLTLQDASIKYVIVDLVQEKIVRWINH